MSTIPAGNGGPQANDPRVLRPYHLIYLKTDDDSKVNINFSIEPGITDLFIISHGWHRNYYSGVSAYDRLIARLMLLSERGKLPAPTDFKSQFVALHWHSDPGENAWLDRAGRRNKDSFIANAEKIFSFTGIPDYLSVLEEAFELFSQLCTGPGEPEFTDWPILQNKINAFTLNNAAGNVPIDQKVMALWTCYHDALPRRPLTNQSEIPSAHIGSITAFKRVLGFALGVIPLLAVGAKLPIAAWASKLLFWPLGLALWFTASLPSKYSPQGLIQLLTQNSVKPLGLHWTDWTTLTKTFSISSIPALGMNLGIIGFSLAICAVLYPLIGWFICFLIKLLNLATPKKANKVTFPRWVLWFLATIYITIPWVAGLFLFLFLGTCILKFTQFAFSRFVFREKSIPKNLFRTFVSYLLRLPAHLIRENLSSETPLPNIIYTVDSQLAFWDMQKRGVSAGIKAADTLEEFLLSAKKENKNLRIHLIGHSFGGLVLLNLWHHLNKTKGHQIPLDTVLLLESATASDWLVGEDKLSGTAATVASVFSRYDTANGFYYPLANGTRNACGFVGLEPGGRTAKRFPKLFREDEPVSEKLSTMFASLADPPLPVTEAPEPILNLDASRMIYQGPVATGGGHDDIFKDDVLYLSWAVIARSFSKASPSP